MKKSTEHHAMICVRVALFLQSILKLADVAAKCSP